MKFTEEKRNKIRNLQILERVVVHLVQMIKYTVCRSM